VRVSTVLFCFSASRIPSFLAARLVVRRSPESTAATVDAHCSLDSRTAYVQRQAAKEPLESKTCEIRSERDEEGGARYQKHDRCESFPLSYTSSEFGGRAKDSEPQLVDRENGKQEEGGNY